MKQIVGANITLYQDAEFVQLLCFKCANNESIPGPSGEYVEYRKMEHLGKPTVFIPCTALRGIFTKGKKIICKNFQPMREESSCTSCGEPLTHYGNGIWSCLPCRKFFKAEARHGI